MIYRWFRTEPTAFEQLDYEANLDAEEERKLIERLVVLIMLLGTWTLYVLFWIWWDDEVGPEGATIAWWAVRLLEGRRNAGGRVHCETIWGFW